MIQNPMIYSDFPDPSVIRVDDTYYMVSTTMYFFPGGTVLRSYDLENWEFVGHLYDVLDETPCQRLIEGNIYGQGMWAPTFQYYEGIFYVLFAANDTQKTYLFTATQPEGPWKKRHVEGFYHDASLLFDDGCVFLAYGNKTIYLQELKSDLSGPKEDGLHRVLVEDKGDVLLGYEGAHLLKREGRYYLFVINWPRTGTNRRTASCFIADSLEGEFKGKVIVDEDLGFHNQGVAQGSMIETPDGDWYLIMFQDRGAVGRVPILLPITFDADGFPEVIDGAPPKSTRPGYIYKPLNASDDFTSAKLAPYWQFNHQPNPDYISLTEQPGALRLTTDKINPNLTSAINTITQRTVGPISRASITLDGSQLKVGDYAGITALQGVYGAITLTKTDAGYELVQLVRNPDYEVIMGTVIDNEPAQEVERIKVQSSQVNLKVSIDFTDLKDTATFYYEENGEWIQLGKPHKLYFKLDHFTGCRFGLFIFATEEVGGHADFLRFDYYQEA